MDFPPDLGHLRKLFLRWYDQLFIQNDRIFFLERATFLADEFNGIFFVGLKFRTSVFLFLFLRFTLNET